VSPVIGLGAVLDTARDDKQLAGSEVDRAVTQLDRQAAVQDEEEVVRVGVRVPHELALGRDDLNLEVVELGDDPGTEVLVEDGELRGEVDLRPLGGPPTRR